MLLSKREFFKSSVIYLGHKVSENGIERDPEKITGEIIVNAFIYHSPVPLLK